MALEPSFAVTTLAVAAVAAGAPLFQDGFRAVRLRRAFARMRERPLADLPTGIVHVRGRVSIESPLFSPLTAKPCAGFRLEVYSASERVRGRIDERRAFRIATHEVGARVWGHQGTWEIGVTDTRAWKPGDALSENMAALLARVPEWDWLRRRGGPLTLTERALLAGAEIHVIGTARQSRPLELAEDVELAATGTDDGGGAAPIVVTAPRRARTEPPDLLLAPGESLNFLLITDTAPANLLRRVAGWRSLNAIAGPALAIAGLSYLAYAIDWLRAHGGR